MTANALVELALTLTGLGQRHDPKFSFNIGTTPTSATYNYRTLSSAGTAELLDLGDVSASGILAIMIKAVDLDILIDCDFSAPFDADLKVKAGEVAFFNPSGIVYVQNEDSGETPSYEYYVIGTT